MADSRYRYDQRPPAPRTSTRRQHLLDYVRVLYKRRWIAIPVFLLVFSRRAR